MPTIRVVLADDATEMRALVAMALRLATGFDIVGEAADGREAVEVAAREQPDLVLLDLAMPVMDGLEALPRILAESPKSVVVVFSGFNEHQLGHEARSRGAADYIEKGVPLDVLVNRITAAYAARIAAGP